MKQKLTAALLALACLCALTACQGKVEPAPSYELSDVQAMADAGAFSEELEELDADIAFALYRLADYGLSREDLKDCAVLRSAGATCEEAAVLLLDGDDAKLADQAEQALKDYIQGQIEANVDYRPDEIPKLENAIVSSRDQSLLLVVANDLEAAKSVVD